MFSLLVLDIVGYFDRYGNTIDDSVADEFGSGFGTTVNYWKSHGCLSVVPRGVFLVYLYSLLQEWFQVSKVASDGVHCMNLG